MKGWVQLQNNMYNIYEHLLQITEAQCLYEYLRQSFAVYNSKEKHINLMVIYMHVTLEVNSKMKYELYITNCFEHVLSSDVYIIHISLKCNILSRNDKPTIE